MTNPALIIFFALAACGCAKAVPGHAATQASAGPRPSSSAGSAGNAGSAVQLPGRVVGVKSGAPLIGVSVAIAGSTQLTNANGRFDVPAGAGPYDIVVTSADQALVSVYLGVVRRDPVLMHLEPDETGPRAHHAEISGNLLAKAGDLVADSSVQMGFFSERANAPAVVRVAPDSSAAAYGPVAVSWDGSEALSGQLLALQMVRGPTLSATFAQSAVTLHDGAKLKLDLAVTRAPIEHRPADRVSQVPEALSASITHDYHLAGRRRVLHGVGPFRTGADYDSPDLTAFGVTFCVEAFMWNPYKRSTVSRCNLPAQTLADLALPDAPVFTQPTRGAMATPGLRFSWSPVPDATYVLALTPERGPSHEAPKMVVYTSRPSAVWPDLRALGVQFPQALNTYGATVSADGPHATLDDAVGPRGPGIPMPNLAWRATSSDLDLPVRPPLGPEEARCDYLKDSGRDGTIVCSPGIPGSVEPSREWYALTAINNELRNYPALAAATGIHCVKTCAQARAYVKALASYAAAHPGFNADEPLGPASPTPPLPPAFTPATVNGSGAKQPH